MEEEKIILTSEVTEMTRDESLDSINPPNKKNKIILLLILIAVLIIVSVIIVSPMKTATVGYNESVSKYNQKIQEYQAAADLAETSNITGLIGDFGQLDEASINYFSLLSSLISGNNIDKINADAKTIEELTDLINDEIVIVQNITNPSEEWILSRLKTVDSIIEMQAVTQEHDPNGLLNKPNGGYSSCIYFNADGISLTEIPGNDIVDKGADVGGAIEVYCNKEDANNRCEYLSEFDNTILYSGSYAVVGTMVIRTSYIFTGEQQLQLTNEITEALTRLE